MIAVVPAAGSSSRMAGCVSGSKVFHELGAGRTVLSYTLRALEASGVCDRVVVGTRTEDVPLVEAEVARLASLRVDVVVGGKTRQETVWNALLSLPESTDYVIVHDGARPFCGAEHIRAVCERARVAKAAILAIPSTSTLKRSTDQRTISQTVPREDIWAAQTPQVFEYGLLLRAHKDAREAGFEGSDDAQLVERIGHPVELVAGSAHNIKITTPDDLLYGNFLISGGVATHERTPRD